MRSPEPSGLKWCQKQNGTLSTGSPLTAACTRSLGVIVLTLFLFNQKYSVLCCYLLSSLTPLCPRWNYIIFHNLAICRNSPLRLSSITNPPRAGLPPLPSNKAAKHRTYAAKAYNIANVVKELLVLQKVFGQDDQVAKTQ